LLTSLKRQKQFAYLVNYKAVKLESYLLTYLFKKSVPKPQKSITAFRDVKNKLVVSFWGQPVYQQETRQSHPHLGFTAVHNLKEKRSEF